MTKYYSDPSKHLTTVIPKFIVLADGSSQNLPSNMSDRDWIKIPGCNIITKNNPITPEQHRLAKVAQLAAKYPYVSETEPGIVVDAQTLIGAIVKAIQAGASLPTDRIPTWRELYNARDFFEVKDAMAMQVLYNGIAIQCGGADQVFILLKLLAEYHPPV